MRTPGDPRTYRVTLKDPSGQIDLNTSEPEVLQRLLIGAGADAQRAETIVDQLLDWRDEDDFTRPRGAEQDDHGVRGVVCRNAPFQAREELLYLPAMTPEVFARVRDDITTAGTGTIHAGSASRAVLMALPGMTPDSADAVIRLREQQALTEEALDRAIPLSARVARSMLRAAPSNVVRIRVDAVGDATLSFEGLAVVDEEGVRALGLRPSYPPRAVSSGAPLSTPAPTPPRLA